jgi:hypothetical protein
MSLPAQKVTTAQLVSSMMDPKQWQIPLPMEMVKHQVLTVTPLKLVLDALLETIAQQVQQICLSVLPVPTVILLWQLNVLLAPQDPCAKTLVHHHQLLVTLTSGAPKELFPRDNASPVTPALFLSALT